MNVFLRIPRVARAFEFMVEAHRGQTYNDLPYFTHPLEVAERVSQFANPTENEIMGALLHDIVEDTKYTQGYVRDHFGDAVSDIVELLTKDNTISYESNIYRIVISKNRSAMRVKLADNYVNMGNDKSHMDADRRRNLNERYTWSIQTLSNVLEI